MRELGLWEEGGGMENKGSREVGEIEVGWE